MNVCFITDPLTTTAGAVRPAILLAREIVKNGYTATLLTLQVNEDIKKELEKMKINLTVVGNNRYIMSSFPTLNAWFKSLIRPNFLDKIENVDVIVNTSSCFVTQAYIYYAQGIMSNTLREMIVAMPIAYRFAYYILNYPLQNLEKRFVKELRKLSSLFIANSHFCGSMYRRWGVKVDGVINPPVDCSFFKPSTLKPSENYVLTHLGVYGKEGRFPVLKAVADAGVRLKVFGKLYYVPRYLLKHPNITFLGKVTDEDLIDLYSNALYTLFAFNHEPFGYIPLESMACGTPVLTYNRQGPSETVINGKTGWLANTDLEIVNLAVKIWKNGFDKHIRDACRERALTFDVKEIFRKWIRILKRGLNMNFNLRQMRIDK